MLDQYYYVQHQQKGIAKSTNISHNQKLQHVNIADKMEFAKSFDKRKVISNIFLPY